MKLEVHEACCVLEMATELEFDTPTGISGTHMDLIRSIFCYFPDLIEEYEPLFRESR
jgi:hypothetical protein